VRFDLPGRGRYESSVDTLCTDTWETTFCFGTLQLLKLLRDGKEEDLSTGHFVAVRGQHPFARVRLASGRTLLFRWFVRLSHG
jgi:hypothetical protein